MKTSLTSGQMQSTLKLLEQKDVNPDVYQRLLSSGILADIFEANLRDCDLNYLRNRIRIPLGLQATGLEVTVRHDISFTELVHSNHYHKIRYKMSDCSPSDMVVVPMSGVIDKIVCDTIDCEAWPNKGALDGFLKGLNVRLATAREFVCFDGEYPFVADYLPMGTVIDPMILRDEGPLLVTVGTNQKPGMERNLSFYSKFFPSRNNGTRLLVVRKK